MKHLIYIIFLFLSLFSCRSEIEQAGTPKGREIAFSALQSDTSLTRATDTGFNTGDEIGIFVVQRSNSGQTGTLKRSGNFAHNKRYRIDSNGQLRAYSEADKIYFQPKELYDIYAYYPYAPAVDPTNYNFRVNSDQTGNNYTRCDLMTAIKATELNQSNILLWFRRKFACIEVSLTKSPSTNITSAWLNGVKNSALLNLGTNNISTLNDSTTVKMNLYEETGNYKFRAIVPVQTLDNDLFTFINNGETVTYKATAEKPLAAGVCTPYFLDLFCIVHASAKVTGEGHTTGSGTYTLGDMVSLTATPADGYKFEAWFDSVWDAENKVTVITKVSDSPDYSFSVKRRYNQFFATFTPKPSICRINIKCEPDRNTLAPYLSLSESANHSYGSQVHLYGGIISDSEYVFAGWYENGNYLHRMYDYDFTATSDRTLTAKYYIRAYQLNMSGRYEEFSVPGYHTKEFKDSRPNSIYLKAGQSIHQACSCFYQDLKPQHSLPIRITKKELRITRGNTEIITATDFEEYTFTATQSGTYTFSYYMSIDFTLLENELTGGSLNIYRLAWYLD